MQMEYLQLLEVVARMGALLIARSAGLLFGHSRLVPVSGIVSLLMALPRSLSSLSGRLLPDLHPAELRDSCISQVTFKPQIFIQSKSTTHQ